MIIKELRDFLREAKDFILAINQGATARELEKIRNSIRGKKPKEVPAISDEWPRNRKTNEDKRSNSDI